MHITKIGNIDYCQDVKRVINPYTREVVFAPCRKCISCLNKKTNAWVGRVANECKKHTYSAFITLTYANEHLPLFQPECINANGEMEWLSNRPDDDNILVGNYDFIPIQNSDVEAIPYCCRQDVVKFMKRLRSNIHYYLFKHNIKTNERLRYFFVSEYGPKTLRPHYHAIIWFDSPELANIMQTMLLKSWSYGRTDYQLVNSTAPQYVAKYVAGNSHLPEVLCDVSTRTFHLQSQAPSIGYQDGDFETFEKEVIDGTYGHYEYDVTSQSSVYVQPPRTLENRIIPKCRAFSTLTHYEKLRIYAYTYDLVKQYGVDCLDYWELSRNHFESPVDLHASYACFRFCCKYRTTPEIYLSYLDRYYYNKEMAMLRWQYEYQEYYIDTLHLPPSDLLSFYPALFEEMPLSLGVFKQRKHLVNVFKSFNISDEFISNRLYHRVNSSLLKHKQCDYDVLNSLRQEYTDFYKSNVLESERIYQNNIKVKVKNEVINPLINM